jgi:hypothetical protein
MPIYRIFTNDIGPMRFSAWADVRGACPREAVMRSRALHLPSFRLDRPHATARRLHLVLAIPLSRKDIWPDEKTGKTKPEARKYMYVEKAVRAISGRGTAQQRPSPKGRASRRPAPGRPRHTRKNTWPVYMV